MRHENVTGYLGSIKKEINPIVILKAFVLQFISHEVCNLKGNISDVSSVTKITYISSGNSRKFFFLTFLALTGIFIATYSWYKSKKPMLITVSTLFIMRTKLTFVVSQLITFLYKL